MHSTIAPPSPNWRDYTDLNAFNYCLHRTLLSSQRDSEHILYHQGESNILYNLRVMESITEEAYVRVLILGVHTTYMLFLRPPSLMK